MAAIDINNKSYEDKIWTEIAATIRSILARQQRSQANLSECSDISRSQLSRFLTAQSSPSITEFLRMCHELNINPSTIIKEARETVKYEDDPDSDRAIPPHLRLQDEE